MKTLGELKNEASRMAGKSDSASLTKLSEAINRRYQEIAVRYNGGGLLDNFDVAVTAGAQSVGLPREAIQVLSVYNATAGVPLKGLTPGNMEKQLGSQRGVAGALRHYCVEGTRGSLNNATGLGLIQVLASAGDSFNMRITGFYGDLGGDTQFRGLPFEYESAVAGTGSAVSFFTMGTYGKLMTVTKDADTTDEVQVYEFATSTLFSYLAPKARTSAYTWLRFASTADVETTLRVSCKLKPADLTSDNDAPQLSGLDHILVVGAVSDLFRSLREFSKAEVEARRFEGLLDNWLFDQESSLEQAPQASGATAEYRDETDAWRVF